MLRLEELTKRYPGQEEPAVDRFSMDVAEGEVVVLVGPSGCGKTTTMKMINRVIEPTSGRVLLEGEDTGETDPDRLRRRIGYVIQQIGLFPHKTIADNIATVPRLLNWDKQRIAERVDELLETVGMDPELYRHRYPKELSGGQRQRVGVARAMGADPPIMLMDEPFGAIDPITRQRLQDEFLRLQEDMRKTIVFVTHDIEEAIKMGDRIAIMRQDSHIAQLATPETILTAPADDFVDDFIGSGASLKRLNLTRVRDIGLDQRPVAGLDADVEEVRRLLERAGDDGHLLLVDEQRRPARWVRAADLEGPGQSLVEAGQPADDVIEQRATLADALDELLTSSAGVAIVVDQQGAYQGVVGIQTVMNAIQAMREEGLQARRAGESPREEGVGSR